MPLSAQKSSQKRQNRTEQTVKQKSSRTQKPAQAQKAQSRNSRGKAAQPQRPSRRTRNNRKQPAYTNANIRGLQGQRAAIQKKIREQEYEEDKDTIEKLKRKTKNGTVWDFGKGVYAYIPDSGSMRKH